MERKYFLMNVLGTIAGIGLIPNILNARKSSLSDPYTLEIVKEFVIAGHNDLSKVQVMLMENPNLIFSMYDWGSGDFETALEGAGHVGDKEIALYLIAAGARANIFVLTMLGKTNIVKPVLEEFPNLVFSKGPHGLSLLHHAKAGGKDSEELFEYVQSKGLNKMKIN
ncbi:MAG: ankyrin repeat domain-containing protein [Bacteroidota bacterium]|nr:ankyrin repeat domain-containing protein [Bacteroidota bacterium]